jgi:hypothetical protein
MDTDPLDQYIREDDGSGVAEGAEDHAYDPSGEHDDLSATAPIVAASNVDSGPCLYLGPAGQRCDRRAVDGAFCAVHRTAGIASKFRDPRRILAAAVTIVVLLWPYVDELVHEIIRWRHSH